MTVVYSAGPYGNISHETIQERPVVFVQGAPAAAPSPNDAFRAFARALTNGIASVGTFDANGTSSVTVDDVNMKTTSLVIISLNTVGGTVGAIPHVETITAGTGFTIIGTASDTSTYNYAIINPQS